MDKKEKYYNYIVDDLIKGTIVKEDIIELPFGNTIMFKTYRSHYYNPYLHLPNIFKGMNKDFSDYVGDRYGVMVYETVFLFDRYRRNLIYKISGNW